MDKFKVGDRIVVKDYWHNNCMKIIGDYGTIIAVDEVYQGSLYDCIIQLDTYRFDLDSEIDDEDPSYVFVSDVNFNRYFSIVPKMDFNLSELV